MVELPYVHAHWTELLMLAACVCVCVCVVRPWYVHPPALSAAARTARWDAPFIKQCVRMPHEPPCGFRGGSSLMTTLPIPLLRARVQAAP